MAHLGTLCHLFENGMNYDDVSNADETQFVINVDNGRTLGFTGETDVRYADAVRGGEGFSMMVWLFGGGRIRVPFIVFENKDRNYPIKCIPDVVPGVAYRLGPKGWIDMLIMLQYLAEKKVIRELPNGHTFCLSIIAADISSQMNWKKRRRKSILS